MEDYVSRSEHAEFSRRLEEENERQNKRLAQLEDSVKQIGSLASSVERLATNMEHMAKEQLKQGEKLEELEDRDGKMWRKAMECIISAIVGGVICYVFVRLGMA